MAQEETKKEESETKEKETEAINEKVEEVKEETQETAERVAEPVEKPKIERIYTIPLGDAYNQPWSKRTRKAARMLKEFLQRHTKKNVKIASDVNEAIWARGMKHPIRKIRVKVEIEGDTATARLLK